MASRHIKTNHSCITSDGWRLHIVRTVQPDVVGKWNHPVILCPGMGSSGAYCFDLSPAISLADYLASQGWDVWIVELRGNGLSDKPYLFKRSRWWTVDDYVDKDIPAVINYVTHYTSIPAVHFLGHSMGGMMLVRVLAKRDATAAKIRSATLVGSGCFLQGSWWQAMERSMGTARLLWTVPSGQLLRLYSRFTFTRMAIPALDMLYFWPTNTDPALARAILARNFSDLSPGIILQFRSAFKACGLTTFKGTEAYADPQRLARVPTPILVMVGDKDNMVPPQGAYKTYELFGTPDKKFVCLGPRNGQHHHYGHFDILMGKHVEQEVFPLLHQWFVSHDSVESESSPPPGGGGGNGGGDTVLDGKTNTPREGDGAAGSAPVSDIGTHPHQNNADTHRDSDHYFQLGLQPLDHDQPSLTNNPYTSPFLHNSLPLQLTSSNAPGSVSSQHTMPCTSALNHQSHDSSQHGSHGYAEPSQQPASFQYADSNQTHPSAIQLCPSPTHSPSIQHQSHPAAPTGASEGCPGQHSTQPPLLQVLHSNKQHPFITGAPSSDAYMQATQHQSQPLPPMASIECCPCTSSQRAPVTTMTCAQQSVLVNSENPSSGPCLQASGLRYKSHGPAPIWLSHQSSATTHGFTVNDNLRSPQAQSKLQPRPGEANLLQQPPQQQMCPALPSPHTSMPTTQTRLIDPPFSQFTALASSISNVVEEVAPWRLQRRQPATVLETPPLHDVANLHGNTTDAACSGASGAASVGPELLRLLAAHGLPAAYVPGQQRRPEAQADDCLFLSRL